MRQDILDQGNSVVLYLPLSQFGDPIAVNSMATVKMPSNRRSSRGWDTSADMRTMTLLVHQIISQRITTYELTDKPRLAQLHLYMSIVIPKRYFQRTKVFEFPVVQTGILAQSFQNKLALGN